ANRISFPVGTIRPVRISFLAQAAVLGGVLRINPSPGTAKGATQPVSPSVRYALSEFRLQ
ncbi:MAG TPA: hypothetical protein PLF18_08250, partial [Anaerolineales bacterium]|nr:hypothetical protein [Anaerolineales bacterium]